MNPIRLPRAAVQLAATPAAELVQLKQTADGAVLTVAAGPRVLRLWATPSTPPENVEPFTVAAVDLVKAAQAVGVAGSGPAHELPLVVVRLSPAVAGIAGPSGTPKTVTICTVRFPDCSGTIDAVEGERASGMTRAVATADARHLHELAETALAIGCTAVQFTFAPRFGQVLAEIEAGPVTLATVIPGGTPQQQLEVEPAPMRAVDDGDPLTFTMPEPTTRRPARRSPAKQARLPCEDHLPW